jgi:hypothetical protein
LLEIQENFFGPSVGLKLVVSTLQCPLKWHPITSFTTTFW